MDTILSKFDRLCHVERPLAEQALLAAFDARNAQWITMLKIYCHSRSLIAFILHVTGFYPRISYDYLTLLGPSLLKCG